MRRAAAALTALAVVAAGCGFKDEPLARLEPTYPLTVVDANRRAVEIAKKPARVVALGASGERFLHRLGVPGDTLPAASGGSALRALQPGLVLVPPGRAASADGLARAAGAPSFVLPGETLPGIERAATAIGLATGHALAGRELALDLRRRRTDVERRVRSRTPVRVVVDLGLGLQPPPDSFLVRLIADAGGELATGKEVRPVSAADLARLDPDVVVTTQSRARVLARLRRQPVTAGLQVAREGRVLEIPTANVPADDRAYAMLQVLAEGFHPEAFA